MDDSDESNPGQQMPDAGEEAGQTGNLPNTSDSPNTAKFYLFEALNNLKLVVSWLILSETQQWLTDLLLNRSGAALPGQQAAAVSVSVSAGSQSIWAKQNNLVCKNLMKTMIHDGWLTHCLRLLSLLMTLTTGQTIKLILRTHTEKRFQWMKYNFQPTMNCNK